MTYVGLSQVCTSTPVQLYELRRAFPVWMRRESMRRVYAYMHTRSTMYSEYDVLVVHVHSSQDLVLICIRIIFNFKASLCKHKSDLRAIRRFIFLLKASNLGSKMSAETVGMKLDAFLSSLDSMPSTQQYGIIVAVTVVVSFSLLGSGGVQEEVPAPTESMPKKKRPLSGPQPKWFVLKWLNYFAVGAFLVSVAHFLWNAQIYLQDSSCLLRFLVGWSLFLCYFFGFFGISFVDTDELAMARYR